MFHCSPARGPAPGHDGSSRRHVAVTLRADGISCMRAGRILFGKLNLDIGPGQALWVRGSNGSGKTSLLRLLCGLARPDTGTVHWNGSDIRASRPEFNAGLVYIGHAAGIKDDLLAWENLALGSAMGGSPVTREQACAALDLAGLPDCTDMPARALSEGQRRRVALARLQFGASRPLWILDEPFTALDGNALGALRATLAAHVARSGTLIYTSHQDIDLPNTAHLDLGQLAGC